MSRNELEDKMAVLLGGRAAEALVFDEISTGAADDLAKATSIARSMVTRFGMVEALGQMAYEEEPQQFLGSFPGASEHRYSEQTAHMIDTAVRELIDTAFVAATEILHKKRKLLGITAADLLEKETLSGEDLRCHLEMKPPAKKAAKDKQQASG